jgi:ribosomal protein S18 acetylase RimI-like enzyme
MQNIHVRIADIAEAEIIASVLHQAFVEFEPLYTPAAFAATTPTFDQIQKRWNEGPVWVAEDEGQIVGAVSAAPKGEGLYVRSMAVLPSHHGRGLGHILLDVTQQFASSKNMPYMFLSTTPFLARAIKLYEQFGFNKNNDEPHELFGTPLFTMVKLLELKIDET